MVESVPFAVELAIFVYLVGVAAIGCYLLTRVWRGKRRQRLEEATRSSGPTE